MGNSGSKGAIEQKFWPSLKSNEHGIPQIRVIVRGSGFVGKTVYIQKYGGLSSEQSITTIFDNYSFTVDIEKTKYNILFYDTAGQETLQEALRDLEIPCCHITIFMFSMVDQTSLDNMVVKFQELKAEYDNRQQKADYILPYVVFIGNKKDLAGESNYIKNDTLRSVLKLLNNIRDQMQVLGNKIPLYLTSCIENEEEAKMTFNDVLYDFLRLMNKEIKRPSTKSSLVENKHFTDKID